MSLSFLTGYVLGQHGRQSMKLAASSATASSPSTEALLDIDDRIDRLVLVVEAMWSLLEEQGHTADQLRERILELDAADGTVDGRRTPIAATCRRCGAKVAPGLASCQFCGADVVGDDADNNPIRTI